MNSTLKRAIAALILSQAAIALADPPSTSAYVTDPQNSYVEDSTSSGIGQVNMITCIMSAMRPDALVNDGAYNALIDMHKCDSKSRASADNANGTVQSNTYATSTVNSTRTSNTEPMRARIWIDDPESEGAAIFVNMSASAAPTASNPYGIFRVDYCGNMEGTPGCAFNGYLDGAASGISYYESEHGDGGGGTKALRMTATSTTTGSGSLHMEDGGSNSETFAFAYNADYYRRSDAGGDQCFARDARDPGTGLSVWRYGLYDSATGARIERSSGFPIEYTHAGTKYQGFLGYYGLSLPPAAQPLLQNGDTVEKVDYSGNGGAPTRTPYTVLKAGGKLTKYTRHTRTLHEIDQIKLNTFVGMEAGSFFAGAQPNTQYELNWDEAAGNFKVTGQMMCGNNGCTTQALSTPQSVDVSFWSARGGIQGWSQQLGGEVFVNLQGVTSPVNSAQVQVVYRSQDLVYPSALPATLHCLRDCPTAASMSAYFSQQSGSPFSGNSANNFQATLAANVVDYTGDATTALLLDGAAAPVVLNADREQVGNDPQFRNGVRTGKLFVNLADAECSQGSGTYCEWKINDLDVYYQWETGPEAYNQFAAVKNANGQFVNFDAPLQVTFNVPQGAAYGQYAGKSLVLQYGGFGDLWGLPGICVSPSTNEEVACDGGEVRYVPSFVIPQDTTTGVVSANGTTYLVKWLEREIRFARKNLSVCAAAGLTVPAGAVLPTSADLKNPSDPNSDIYIGVRPVVTAAPRVIQGEVKY